MINQLESILRVINNGFPRIDPVGVELYFKGVIDSLEQDRQTVSREIPKSQKALRQGILSDISGAVKQMHQYNAEERAFVVAVCVQNNRLPNGRNETYLNHIVPFAEENDGRSMLEIGFGDGASFQYFRSWDYTGLEVSPYAVWKARKKEHTGGKRLRMTKDGQAFPVNDASINFILAYNSIHQIKSWQFELDECVRTLNEGGRIYVVERRGEVNNSLHLPNIGRFDKDYNTPEQVAEYLQIRGLNVQLADHKGTYWGEVLIPSGYFEFAHITAIKE